MYNPFANLTVKEPFELYLEGLADGWPEDAALGNAEWISEDRDLWLNADPTNAQKQQRARNKGQAKICSLLFATGRGTDIARVALKIETKSWVAKAEPASPGGIEDYLA